MAEPLETRIARLDEDGLDTLERRLTIALVKMSPGAPSRVRGAGEEVVQITPERTELETVVAEILEAARSGVKIAPQTESRPLIPLFKAAKLDLPPEIKVDHEKLKYEFYFVETTFSIFLSKDQFPLSAVFELTLTDDVIDRVRRTRPIRLFPGRKDIQYFSVDLEGAIGIDASMSISTPQLGLTIPSYVDVAAKAAVDANFKARFVVGPLTFPFRKAAIEVRGEGDQSIFWRYNLQSELAGTNTFKSVLVLKVAEEVHSIQMPALLRVTPCKHRWLLFKDVLPELSDRVTLPIEIVQRRK